MTAAARLGVKVFIDGYEVPVVGVSCEFVDTKGAAAQVQLVPTSSFFLIEPRAHVCIFYHHSGALSAPLTSKEGENSDSYDSPKSWKLLFMGEYVSYSYRKAEGSREIIMQCADITNYWDTMKQHGTNYRGGGVESIENAFMGIRADKSTKTTSVGKDMKTNLTSWVNASKVGNRVSPALGVHRVLHEMFFVGNIFYSKAFNRHRMGDMIVGLPEDMSSINLFKYRDFKKYIKEKVLAGGNFITMRQVLERLMSPMFYSFTPIPAPIIRNDRTYAGMSYEYVNKTDLKKVVHMEKDSGEQTLNYLIAKPDLSFAPPPVCNVLFPWMYSSFNTFRAHTQEPTRMIMRTENLIKRHQWQKLVAAYSNTDVTAPVVYQQLMQGLSTGSKYLKDRLYAPDFEAFEALMERPSDGGGYLARLHEVLMPHEEFVGPNSLFTWDGSIAKFTSEKGRKKYLSFAADFLFWQAYFGSRRGSLTAVFNPNLVPGFSCVVMDKVTSNEGGIHFVGFIDSIKHVINASGASTTLALSKLRPHTENIDFDNIAEQKAARDNPDKLADVLAQTRPVEEICMRRSGGFFDMRYAGEKLDDSEGSGNVATTLANVEEGVINDIGANFYSPLLGCESILEDFKIKDTEGLETLKKWVRKQLALAGGTELENALQKEAMQRLQSLLARLDAGVTNSSGTVVDAVDSLDRFLWMFLSNADLDEHKFSAVFTSRKGIATLPDILGNSNKTLISDEVGFSIGATDPESGDAKATYTGMNREKKISTVTVPSVTTVDPDIAKNPEFKEITKDWIPDNAESTAALVDKLGALAAVWTETTPATTKKVSSFTYTEEKGIPYGLSADIEFRQKGVKEYVDSLQNRGMRG